MAKRKNPADSKGYYYETGFNNSYGSPMRVHIADPEDADADNPVFVFQFGAYGDMWVAVVGQNDLEDAMDVVGQWLEDNAPGIFTDIEYPSDLNSMDDEEMYRAMEEAETDMTNFSTDGSSQWWVPSWEWYVNEYGPKSKEARRARDAVFNTKPARSGNPSDGSRLARVSNPRNY